MPFGLGVQNTSWLRKQEGFSFCGGDGNQHSSRGWSFFPFFSGIVLFSKHKSRLPRAFGGFLERMIRGRNGEATPRMIDLPFVIINNRIHVSFIKGTMVRLFKNSPCPALNTHQVFWWVPCYPLFWGRVPVQKTDYKTGCPYSNLSTGRSIGGFEGAPRPGDAGLGGAQGGRGPGGRQGALTALGLDL